MHFYIGLLSQRYILGYFLYHNAYYTIQLHVQNRTHIILSRVNRLLKEKTVYRDIFNPFAWLKGCVHRILPCLESLLVGTGQIMCIFFSSTVQISCKNNQ